MESSAGLLSCCMANVQPFLASSLPNEHLNIPVRKALGTWECLHFQTQGKEKRTRYLPRNTTPLTVNRACSSSNSTWRVAESLCFPLMRCWLQTATPGAAESSARSCYRGHVRRFISRKKQTDCKICSPRKTRRFVAHSSPKSKRAYCNTVYRGCTFRFGGVPCLEGIEWSTLHRYALEISWKQMYLQFFILPPMQLSEILQPQNKWKFTFAACWLPLSFPGILSVGHTYKTNSQKPNCSVEYLH